ncbi:MAG: HAD family hydrolase [Xenococcaceae cyanobacterium]
MTLKAIFFDFNGVTIDDESIHQQLIEEILLSENLRPESSEYREVCLGRSDRVCLRDLLARRGRIVSETYLDKLIRTKTQAYQDKLAKLEQLPIYPEILDFLPKLKAQGLSINLVSGALRSEIELVLSRANLSEYFEVIVAGDDIQASKPEPEAYLLALERLNQKNSQTYLKPSNCLAIEDTIVGIQAAKRAGIQVVGVANTYPLHMLQRQANWAVDFLRDIELDRVSQILSTI